MNSLLNSDTEIKDHPAKSSPPWVWFGFLFALAFLVAEFLEVGLELDHPSFQFLFILIVLSGWIYWLFCVHRFHKILAEMTSNRYPISPGEAVGKHFIPFYNFYWLFAWPSALAKHINSRGHVRMLPGGVIGFLLLLSILLRYLDGAFGLAVTFGVGLYISAKLRRHMALVKGVAPGMLPPPPDPGLFSTPAANRESSAPPLATPPTTQL
jgi:hypothetical protein